MNSKVVLALVLVSALVFIVIYNRLVRSRLRTREAWSGIDVQLQRRTSLIPSLVEMVKGYASHERDVFESVARARSALRQAGGPAEAAGANEALMQAVGRLVAVAENYPQLRASESFLNLQIELADTEDKIAFARQFYNRNVTDFNRRLEEFPSILLASLFRFRPFEFFEAKKGRGDLQVSFATSGEPSSPGRPAGP
jgi:LemA protein